MFRGDDQFDDCGPTAIPVLVPCWQPAGPGGRIPADASRRARHDRHRCRQSPAVLRRRDGTDRPGVPRQRRGNRAERSGDHPGHAENGFSADADRRDELLRSIPGRLGLWSGRSGAGRRVPPAHQRLQPGARDCVSGVAGARRRRGRHVPHGALSNQRGAGVDVDLDERPATSRPGRAPERARILRDCIRIREGDFGRALVASSITSPPARCPAA